MRVCLFTSTALPRVGGQELVVDQLARHFLSMGQEARVLVPYPRTPLVINDHELPYPVVRAWRWRTRWMFLHWYASAISSLYRRWPFDILHCHNVYPPAYLASLVRKRVPAPVVVTSHGGDVYEHSSLVKKPHIAAQMTQALRSADALISISRFTTEGFLRLHANPKLLTVIPNGINMDDFARPAPRPVNLSAGIVPGKYIVFLGRFSGRKGVDVLLRAWQHSGLAQEASLVVIGDGAEMPLYQQLVRELGIGESVHFTGMKTGAEKVYLLKNARFGVIPSRAWEAFPLVVLEMQAARLPIIATDIPGLRDLIEPGVTGVTVPSEDARAMGKAIVDLWRRPEQIQAMGDVAGKLAPDFAWPVIARKHLDLFDNLLGKQRSAAA